MRLTDGSEFLVAVYVETKEDWIVDEDYVDDHEDLPSDRCRLSLRRSDGDEENNETRPDPDEDKVKEYLKENTDHEAFSLPESSSSLDKIANRAFHMWVSREAGGHEFIPGRIQRVWKRLVKSLISFGGKWTLAITTRFTENDIPCFCYRHR
jgi:hypothetical protein